MRLSHRAFMPTLSASLALAAVLTVSPAAATDLPESAAPGSGSSSGSTSRTVGSAGIPALDALFPRTNPYSSETDNNLVTFGDSFTANSHWLINKYPLLGFAYPKQAGCFIAPDAWPALAGAEIGKPVQNWACNAHTSGQMLERIDRAIAADHINNTSTVVLAAGMNDKRRNVADATVQANLVAGVEKVRAVAPEAEILLLGRLSTTNNNEVYCNRNIIPNLPFGETDATTARYERATQANHQAAADTTKVRFIDIREMTVAKNSTCGLDADRYVSGHWDLTTPAFNMTAHPSIAGSRFLAEQIVAAFGTDGAEALLDVIEDLDLDDEPTLSDVTDELDEVLEDRG